MEEAEVLARAKTEAKEAAKEAAKDALKEKDCRKVPAKTKVALEEALGQKHPGTPGLTGKQHSSTGRSFLQLLLKAKKEGSYDLPRWEDRCPFCCTKLEQTKNRSPLKNRNIFHEEFDLSWKSWCFSQKTNFLERKKSTV